MKTLTPKQLEAQTKNNNRRFTKASRAQKRVMIAKDVIARVKSGQFRPTEGVYLNSKVRLRPSNSPVQPLIVGGEPCRACAAGSMVLSCTALNNRQTVSQLSGDLSIISHRTCTAKFSNGLDCFNRSDLFRIEDAFMGWRGGFAFHDRHPDAKERLLAIMQNIVTNKGAFKP